MHTNFSPFKTIVDIGGGYGTLLAAVLRSNQTARGILFSTLSLVARIDLLTGQVHAGLEERHRAHEFTSFLKKIDAAHPLIPQLN